MPGKWIYNTLEQWKKLFPTLSEYKIRKYIRQLQDLELLIFTTQVKHKKGVHLNTKWYSINYDKYDLIIRGRDELKARAHREVLENVEQFIAQQKHDNIYYRSQASSLLEPHLLLPKSSEYSDENRQNNIHNTLHNNLTSPSISSSSLEVTAIKKIGEEEFLDIDLEKRKEAISEKLLTQNLVRVPEVEKVYEPVQKTKYTNRLSDFVTNSKHSIVSIDEQKAITNSMFEIWESVHQYAVKPIKAIVNDTTRGLLMLLYYEVFDQSIEKWHNYCLLINSSKFLMGEAKTNKNFKATFFWLIEKTTAEKILGGKYTTNDRILDIHKAEKNGQQLAKEIIEQKLIQANDIVKTISDQDIEEEFKQYIKDQGYMSDDDFYGIKDMVWNNPTISTYSLLTDDRFKWLYLKLFEAYRAKKVVGHSIEDIKLQVQQSIDKHCEGCQSLERVLRLHAMKESLFLGVT